MRITRRFLTAHTYISIRLYLAMTLDQLMTNPKSTSRSQTKTNASTHPDSLSDVPSSGHSRGSTFRRNTSSIVLLVRSGIRSTGLQKLVRLGRFRPSHTGRLRGLVIGIVLEGNKITIRQCFITKEPPCPSTGSKDEKLVRT